MMIRRLASITAIAAFTFAACTSGGGAATTAPSAPAASAPAASEPAGSPAAGACTVGMSWNNYQEERWAKWDEPAMKAAIEAGGGTYISNDAKSSSETQASNIENLISQGAKVVIVLAQDRVAAKPAVEAALAQNIPVIAYDRLIEAAGALYITFDNVLVGKMEAEEVLKVVSEGNFVIIKGNQADANADFLREGYVQAGIPPVGESSDKIKIVGESYTDNWDPSIAQTNMEQFLTANNNDVDAVLSENDGMAGGVVAALQAQGLAGKVPVSGQDGDQAALNRVALGTQTVSVWKDARELGKAAGEAAVALCSDPDVKKIANTQQFTSPYDKVDLTSVFLTPIPITKDNLNVVVDAGWIDTAALCQGVTAGSVPACP
jgi:D-xylose transport system substrate-binding protein